MSNLNRVCYNGLCINLVICLIYLNLLIYSVQFTSKDKVASTVKEQVFCYILANKTKHIKYNFLILLASLISIHILYSMLKEEF